MSLLPSDVRIKVVSMSGYCWPRAENNLLNTAQLKAIPAFGGPGFGKKAVIISKCRKRAKFSF